MNNDAHTIAMAFDLQAAQAERIGSPLYARLLEGLFADYNANGVTAELLEGVSDRPVHDALPLRYLATAHHLALRGEAGDLAQYYGSCGGVWQGEDLTPIFLEIVQRERETFARGLRRNVQTNEVGRAAVLASGFALIARRHRPELDVLEIGSSAGLLSRWDRYFYDTGRSRLGDATSPLQFDASWWTDRVPQLGSDIDVVRRRASDVSPIDVSTHDGRLMMLSFVWPDQSERVERLRAALEVAQQYPLTVESADAGQWLADQFESGLHPDRATVVFHSIVWQYLSEATRTTLRDALFSAGGRATADTPLLWMRMEPATAAFADLRLTTWPGGLEEVLAEVGYHGAGVRWLAAD